MWQYTRIDEISREKMLACLRCRILLAMSLLLGTPLTKPCRLSCSQPVEYSLAAAADVLMLLHGITQIRANS